MSINQITYLGETVNFDIDFELISNDEFISIQKEWYQLPSKDLVLNEISKFSKGGNNTTNIVKYYYRELMDDTKKKGCHWTINEFMNSRELVSWAINKINRNKKVFDGQTMKRNIDTVFRLGGSHIANRVSNFPLSTCDEILTKYNVNDNYYDFSCGWGARLMCSLRKNINYYGTDPNYKLVEKLNEFIVDYRNVTGNTNTEAKIYCQGSQEFIPELENKIGIAFSSPPYFDLEDYRYGNQSYKKGTTYESWVNNYLKPTFQNIHRYLVQNGFLIVNVKDYANIPLESTIKEISSQCGFKLFNNEELKQSFRVIKSSQSDTDRIDVSQNENVFVFVKEDFDFENNSIFGVNESSSEIEIRTSKEHTLKKESVTLEEVEREDLW